jgi:hypothetical protein
VDVIQYVRGSRVRAIEPDLKSEDDWIALCDEIGDSTLARSWQLCGDAQRCTELRVPGFRLDAGKVASNMDA